MDGTTITISIELELADDCLTGYATGTSGERREFMGWLGLMATIDALVDESQTTALGHANESRRTS